MENREPAGYIDWSSILNTQAKKTNSILFLNFNMDLSTFYSMLRF